MKALAESSALFVLGLSCLLVSCCRTERCFDQASYKDLTDASINDQTANMLQRAGHELVCLAPEWSPSPHRAWSFAEDLMRILRVSCFADIGIPPTSPFNIGHSCFVLGLVAGSCTHSTDLPATVASSDLPDRSSASVNTSLRYALYHPMISSSSCHITAVHQLTL